MIKLTCDRCEKPFEVGDDVAGLKAACPACGDTVRVPALPAVGSVKVDRAAAAGMPPAQGPEKDVMKIRPAMMRAKPIRFFALWLMLLGGAAGAIACAMSVGLLWLAVLLGLVAFAAAGMLAFWKLLTLGSTLSVSSKRSVHRKGLLTRRTSEVMHEDIRNIQIYQSLQDRMFGVGRLSISSSADDELEISVKDIRNPDKVRLTIDLYRPI